jgi:hypothetical protein
MTFIHNSPEIGPSVKHFTPLMNSSSSSLSLSSTSSSSAGAVRNEETVTEGGLRLLNPIFEVRMQQLLQALSTTIQICFWPAFDSNNSMEGIRTIQKDRVELFVRCANQSCAAFDQLCRQLLEKTKELDASYNSPKAIRKAIIAYAKSATVMEDRLMTQINNCGGRPKIHYGPFSLILTRGTVPPQLPHVDVLPPNFQFGLIVTDDTPATRVNGSNHPVVRTLDDLVNFLQITPDSSKIPAVMAQCPDLVELLQNFGICFSTMNPSDYCVTSELDHLKNGTVMSLPGGQLHAGPGYTGFHAVLFWTAHGKSKDVYDINVQYFDECSWPISYCLCGLSSHWKIGIIS